MIKKIAQFPVSFVLTIVVSMMALSLLFLATVGVIAGLFVEMFKFHSRVSINELIQYRISKPIEKGRANGKAKKVFKLPLRSNVRSSRMIYVREK